MQVKTQNIWKQQDQCFLHIMVRFHTYLFILIHDRTLLILMLLLTHPNHVHRWHVNTQTIFMVLFTSGSLLTWGKPLDASSGISPRYLSTIYSQLTVFPFFYRHPIMTDYTFFSQGLDRWGKEMALLWGEPHHLPPTTTVPHTLHNSSRAVLLYQPQGLGRETEDPPQHCLPVNISWGGSYRGQEIWSINHMGKSLVRPGSAPWRKWLGNWLPGSPVDPIGPMPWCSYTKTPAMCHSLRRGT